MSAPTDPNFDIYATQRGRILGTVIALFVLTPASVGLRLLSRKLSRVGFWWDDYLCVVALVAALVCPALLVYQLRNGFGTHIHSYAPAEQLAKATAYLRGQWIFELMFHLATTLAKLAILAFYHRIFPVPGFRRLLLWVAGLCMLYLIALIPIIVFQCHPIHYAWEQANPKAKGHCISDNSFFIPSGTVNACLNFLIFALPIPLLMRLRTTLKQQIVLLIMFSLAGFVVLVSVIWVIVVAKPSSEDITWNFVNAGIWSALEPTMAVICASIPSLRPLFSVLGRGFSHGPFMRSTLNSNGGPSSSKRTWGSAVRQSDGTFSQLDEADDLRPLGHRAHAGQGDEEGMEMPQKGITVRTEITQVVTDRLDYNDRLF